MTYYPIPRVGLGTWQLTGESCSSVVSEALEVGYRHIDTAQVYKNEEDVGRALERSRLPRESYFLTTKVWIDNFHPDLFARSIEQSLEKLRVSYVDLLLLHWPSKDYLLSETIGLLNQALLDGKTKAIGVSNFTIPMLKEAIAFSNCRIVTNQIEFHPMLDQRNQIRFCQSADVVVTAYSPLCRGKILKHPIMRKIAEEKGVTTAQVALAWLLHHENVAVIPKTSSRDRLESNFKAAQLELSDEECRQVAKLSSPNGRRVDPPNIAPDWSEDLQYGQ